MRKLTIYLLWLVVWVLLAMPLSAGPIIVGNANWYEFSWSGVATAKGCFPADPGGLPCTPSSGGNSQFADAPPWTFSGPAYLTVVDAFILADRFEVFDNLVSLGMTSLPFEDPDFCGSDPANCLSNPFASFGVFLLGAGDHSITINQINQTLYSGAGPGYFRLDPIPEPSTWLLMSGPLLIFALIRKRRVR